MTMQGIMNQSSPQDPHQEPDADEQPGGMPDNDADEQDGSNNPAYEAAMEVVMKALYKDKGAVDVAKAMQGSDPAQGLADVSYQIVQVADERTNGEVPDELLASLAADVVSEVAEVAHAAGAQINGSVISKAMQLMVVRFLKDQGVDPAQIQQQMAAVDQQANVGQALDQASEQEG